MLKDRNGLAKQILIILSILIIIAISIIIVYYQKKPDQREAGKTIGTNENNDRDVQEEASGSKEQFNENQETLNAQEVGSGGSSGGGSGSESSSETCLKKQISYSIQDPTEIVNCLEYSGSVCIKKEMNCSVDVHNLDNEIAGLFKIQIIFSQDSSGQGVYSELKELYLAPKESNIIWTYKIFESAEENGPANSEISCFYTKLEVPVREIC